MHGWALAQTSQFVVQTSPRLTLTQTLRDASPFLHAPANSLYLLDSIFLLVILSRKVFDNFLVLPECNEYNVPFIPP